MPLSKKPYLLNKFHDLARKNELITLRSLPNNKTAAIVEFTVKRGAQKRVITLLYDFSDTQRGYVTMRPMPLNGISISFTANMIKQVIDKTVYFGFLESLDVKNFHF